jgi:uncharacterized protein involved in exopolysaccharide biosynthesis
MEESFRLLKPYLRGFPLILLAMFIAVWIAHRYLQYATPMYESTLKMRLADINENVPNSNLFKDFDVFVSSNKIATEIEVIKSQTLLYKVLDSLDFGVEIYRIGALRETELYHESPFKIVGKLNSKGYDKKFKMNVHSHQNFTLVLPTQKTVKGTFGKEINFEYGTVRIDIDKDFETNKKNAQITDKYSFEFLSKHKQVGKISKNLDVMAVDKDVAVVRINFKSNMPEKAAKLVNKLAEMYISDYIETKYKSAHTTVQFLDGQIAQISSKLANSENVIQGFRDAKHITNIRQETETDLRKISQMKIQQTNVKMNLDAIKDLNEYIAQGKHDFLSLAPNFEAFTDLLSTEIIKKIKQLQGDKKDLLLTYTAEDERVKVIDKKIADLTSYLVESIQNTEKNLTTKYKRLSDDIEEAQKVFLPVPEKEKILTAMNREFEIFQQSYIFLNEKKIEADIARAAKIAFHRIISPAQISKEPVSPNKIIILIVSAILGMFMMIVAIFIVHTWKGKVNDAHNIERNSSIPLVMLTPMLYTSQKIAKHFLNEAIQLELKGLVNKGNVLVFSSYKGREGKQFHIQHLIEAWEKQGRKIALVNMVDIWKEVQYFTKENMQNLLEAKKEAVDLVVVHNTSLEEVGLSLQMMSLADTNFVLLDSRVTPRKIISKIDLLQQEYKLPNMQFILNKAGYNPNIALQVYRFIKKKFVRYEKISADRPMSV